MAMTLQEAIDFASVNADTAEYGIEVHGGISLHEDSGLVLLGGAHFPTFTYRPDLPLLNWGPATFRIGGLFRSWLGTTRPVPGFSTRGLGGMTLDVGPGTGGGAPTANAMTVDLSVRRDPGRPGWNAFGLGPSVYIEIETLSAAGAATGGVTLKAVEDGALVRAVGPSVRDPAANASYTFTIITFGRPG
jgi:hypothetical protein